MQELFYCTGAEAVDGAHLTVELFHQVEGTFLIRVDQHAGPVLGILRGARRTVSCVGIKVIPPDLVLKGQTQRTVPRALGRGPRELQGQMRRQAGQGGRLGHAGKPPSDARDGGGRRYRHGSGGGTDPRPRERDRLLPCFPAALRSDRTAAAGRAPQLESSH